MLDIDRETTNNAIRFIRKLISQPGENVTLFGYERDKDTIGKFGLIPEEISPHGFCMTFDDVRAIFVNEKQTAPQLLFTVAHEAGHLQLDNFVEKNREWEADLFAAMFMFLLEGALPIMKQYRNGMNTYNKAVCTKK